MSVTTHTPAQFKLIFTALVLFKRFGFTQDDLLEPARMGARILEGLSDQGTTWINEVSTARPLVIPASECYWMTSEQLASYKAMKLVTQEIIDIIGTEPRHNRSDFALGRYGWNFLGCAADLQPLGKTGSVDLYVYYVGASIKVVYGEGQMDHFEVKIDDTPEPGSLTEEAVRRARLAGCLNS
jgi:hypothetical protein